MKQLAGFALGAAAAAVVLWSWPRPETLPESGPVGTMPRGLEELRVDLARQMAQLRRDLRAPTGAEVPEGSSRERVAGADVDDLGPRLDRIEAELARLREVLRSGITPDPGAVTRAKEAHPEPKIAALRSLADAMNADWEQGVRQVHLLSAPDVLRRYGAPTGISPVHTDGRDGQVQWSYEVRDFAGEIFGVYITFQDGVVIDASS